MPFSKEEGEKIIKEKNRVLDEYILNQDAKGVSTLYHPKAVLLHDGEEHPITSKKPYEGYLTVKVPFKDYITYTASTDDGKYLVMHGEFTLDGVPGKIEYEQTYQLQDDGDYLIYYQRRGVLKQ
ncbi:hypothetical protein M3Y97_01086800 [Aphelenchoides bicaudatus]|nr:hypothetical protein M3Y97_01086800 [Aphelenchoides bicaudatus]